MAQRIYLAILGLVLVGTGIAALVNPQGVVESLGIAVIDISGQSEMRATYGGLPLGWGLLLIAGLRYQTLALSGLVFTLFGGGGLLLARFATALAIGPPAFTGTVTSLILFEVVMVAFAYVLLRRAIKDEGEPEVIR